MIRNMPEGLNRETYNNESLGNTNLLKRPLIFFTHNYVRYFLCVSCFCIYTAFFMDPCHVTEVTTNGSEEYTQLS